MQNEYYLWGGFANILLMHCWCWLIVLLFYTWYFQHFIVVVSGKGCKNCIFIFLKSYLTDILLHWNARLIFIWGQKWSFRQNFLNSHPFHTNFGNIPRQNRIYLWWLYFCRKQIANIIWQTGYQGISVANLYFSVLRLTEIVCWEF